MNTKTRLVGMAAAVAVAALSAHGQIALSRHNFSSYGWSRGEICLPCHTPHNSNTSVGFLWNHALTEATYQMHEGTGTAVADIDSRSRLCLSCHDGTVALDSFGGTTGTNTIGPAGNVGTDLTNDHPIGSDSVYPDAGSAGRLNPSVPSSFGTRAVGTGSTVLRLRPWDDAGTTKYVVGCSTCHTVHNAGNFPHMLRFSNASSQLCLTCHIK
jgi:predicted CXXCH cytochrome family protein